MSSANDLSCSDCSINKSHKLPFYSNTIASYHPLEYLYTDVWSSPIVSIDGYKYYLVIVDLYTRYTWLYPLKLKSQVHDTFIRFKVLVENRFKHKIGTLYSDNGGEFIALRQFLSTHCITHLTTPPHTPELNGISERKHRHVVETGLTLLGQALMPKTYWSYAFTTAVYLINRMITPVLGNVSPYQKLFGQPPNYHKLRVFGSECFPWLRPYTKHKLEPRSASCVFIGYSLTQSAYLCLHRESGRIYTSRHVVFNEKRFPFASPVSGTTASADTSDQRTGFAPTTMVPVRPLINTSPSCSAPHQHSPSATPVPDAIPSPISPQQHHTPPVLQTQQAPEPQPQTSSHTQPTASLNS